MSDHSQLNLKIGLEIHQQIEGNKLFCKCPGITNKQEQPDFLIKRKLRATAGELGSIDIAAKYEQEKAKLFIYEAYKDCNCLVELDEEPPHEINQHALQTALEISLLLKAAIIDEVQVMRKIVVDGSNVSGFQRTALIAINGSLETTKGIVKIPTICLEEEAAKKIKESESAITYRLDRLGIPLIEIATSPDIKSPEHAKEVASKLGMILRSTEKVKRGLGTIRQDVNLSIKNYPRIELKGFQDLRSIPKTIEKEIERQLKQAPKEKEVRKVNQDFSSTFLRPMPSSSRMYPETDIPVIQITKEFISAIKIPKLIVDASLQLEGNYNLQSHIAEEIIKKKISLESYTKQYRTLEPETIAFILVELPKEIKSRFNLNPEHLKQEHFTMLLSALDKKIITKESVLEILKEILETGNVNINKYKPVSIDKIESEIITIVNNNLQLSTNALMGMIMEKYRGKIDGKKVAEIINKTKK
ncbi:MAG TPA: Glu-tRNA(Gln) amidotransferase subunit GatE [Candidatus Nanoarchaeia archaeon]|nr:Glu-tRNA(Gln) amidotransferase subunit GatE [Candidatus Nanoarchaeia archaeon]